MNENNFVIKKEQQTNKAEIDLSLSNEVSTHKIINQYIFSKTKYAWRDLNLSDWRCKAIVDCCSVLFYVSGLKKSDCNDYRHLSTYNSLDSSLLELEFHLIWSSVQISTPRFHSFVNIRLLNRG